MEEPNTQHLCTLFTSKSLYPILLIKDVPISDDFKFITKSPEPHLQNIEGYEYVFLCIVWISGDEMQWPVTPEKELF